MNTRKVAAAKRAEPSIVTLNGCYLVDPEISASELLEDASGWLVAATEIVNQMAIELGDDGTDLYTNPQAAAKILWGAFHLLQMADGATQVAHARFLREAKP
jgi:hypothetical protein